MNVTTTNAMRLRNTANLVCLLICIPEENLIGEIKYSYRILLIQVWKKDVL
jgi:hypothetical protein